MVTTIMIQYEQPCHLCQVVFKDNVSANTQVSCYLTGLKSTFVHVKLFVRYTNILIPLKLLMNSNISEKVHK